MATHTTMPRKLAQALIEAGMQHHDLGGFVSDLGSKGIGGFGALGSQLTGMTNGSILGGGAGLDPTNRFKATAPEITTQNLNPQITYNAEEANRVYNQQQGLANQLLAQTQGQGPNPALAQLNQTTGQNVANQAALMASQRGASANPALLARQAAMQGANTQQQAVGQGATLQAQQQLAAQQALAQQQAQMAQQNLQGESIYQGALAAQNSALTQGSLGAQNINANIQGQNASTRGGLLGGLLGGVAGGLSSGLGFSQGGEVPNKNKMATGGEVNGIAQYQTPGIGIPQLDIPQANTMGTAGKSMGNLGGGLASGLFGGAGGSAATGTLMAGGAGDAIAGGAGDALLEAAPLALAYKGGKIPFSQMLAGGNVPGKAKVKGDNKKNDTVPTLLSPGEIVLPRSVTESSNVEAKAVEFLKHLKSKKRGYKAVADARKAKDVS